MSSIGESIMLNALARLQGSPSLMLGAQNVAVKRSHRTPVARDDAPMVHLIDGPDRPTGNIESDCDREREKRFTVSVFIRDDGGAGVADPLVVEINNRMSNATPWGDGIRVTQGPIVPDEEIADGDAIRVDMEFAAKYDAPGWSLEAA